jgi:hypothetical protein
MCLFEKGFFKMKKIVFAIVGCFLISSSCSEESSYSDCKAFCDLIDLLGCPEADGSPGIDSDYSTIEDNISCEELCELYIDVVQLDCYNNINSCEDLRECED